MRRKAGRASAAFVLKITLCGLRPPVWRRVRVSTNSSLRMLHLVIQAAMGWQDDHLHEFEIGGRRYGEPDDEALPGDEPTYNESNVKLGALIERGVERFATARFGDGWSTRSWSRRWSRSTRSSPIPR